MSRTHNDTGFVFAHWNQKNKAWKITNIRFLLNPSNTLYGQYITSMWFNVEMSKKEKQLYMIIGLKDRSNKRINKLENFMNFNYTPSINDMPKNVDFCEYFEIPSDRVENIWEKTKEKGSYRDKINGSKNNILRINFHSTGNMLLATLPEFTIDF